MSDLISRTALLEAMPKNDEILSFEVRRVICKAPAVDAEPVRHGRWKNGNNRPFTYLRLCSVCGKESYFCGNGCSYNYCPNCGAKMDAEVEG